LVAVANRAQDTFDQPAFGDFALRGFGGEGFVLCVAFLGDFAEGFDGFGF